MNRTPDNTEIRVAGRTYDGTWILEWRTRVQGCAVDKVFGLSQSSVPALFPYPVSRWSEWEECRLTLEDLHQMGFHIQLP